MQHINAVTNKKEKEVKEIRVSSAENHKRT